MIKIDKWAMNITISERKLVKQFDKNPSQFFPRYNDVKCIKNISKGHSNNVFKNAIRWIKQYKNNIEYSKLIDKRNTIFK